jgi:hypothetical protein
MLTEYCGCPPCLLIGGLYGKIVREGLSDWEIPRPARRRNTKSSAQKTMKRTNSFKFAWQKYCARLPRIPKNADGRGYSPPCKLSFDPPLGNLRVYQNGVEPDPVIGHSCYLAVMNTIMTSSLNPRPAESTCIFYWKSLTVPPIR